MINYWAGKVRYVVGITGDPRILIVDGLPPFGVECRVSSVSVRFGELRSAQLGSSECTLWWTIRYFIPDLVLAVSWRASHHSSRARSTLYTSLPTPHTSLLD